MALVPWGGGAVAGAAAGAAAGGMCPFAELGLPADATPQEVRDTFLAAAARWHPDSPAPGAAPDAARFAAAHAAYIPALNEAEARVALPAAPPPPGGQLCVVLDSDDAETFMLAVCGRLHVFAGHRRVTLPVDATVRDLRVRLEVQTGIAARRFRLRVAYAGAAGALAAADDARPLAMCGVRDARSHNNGVGIVVDGIDPLPPLFSPSTRIYTGPTPAAVQQMNPGDRVRVRDNGGEWEPGTVVGIDEEGVWAEVDRWGVEFAWDEVEPITPDTVGDWHCAAGRYDDAARAYEAAATEACQSGTAAAATLTKAAACHAQRRCPDETVAACNRALRACAGRQMEPGDRVRVRNGQKWRPGTVVRIDEGGVWVQADGLAIECTWHEVESATPGPAALRARAGCGEALMWRARAEEELGQWARAHEDYEEARRAFLVAPAARGGVGSRVGAAAAAAAAAGRERTRRPARLQMTWPVPLGDYAPRVLRLSFLMWALNQQPCGSLRRIPLPLVFDVWVGTPTVRPVHVDLP